MAEDEVDVLELQSLERGAQALAQVLGGEADLVDAVAAPEDLRGENQVRPTPQLRILGLQLLG